MIRCAFFEMKRLPSSVTPRCTSDPISSISDPGSTTTPQPMTQRQPGWRIPDGIVCRTYFSRPATTVWPALLPPANRATTFTWGARMSTIFPLPSSPHCMPTTTMLGMAHSPEEASGLRQDFRHGQDALGTVREVERKDLLGLRARAPDDRSEEHTSELQSRPHLVCRLLLEKKKKITQSVKSRQLERKLGQTDKPLKSLSLRIDK